MRFVGLMIAASTFVPLPADAFVLDASTHHRPLQLALTGGATSAIVALVEAAWIRRVIDHPHFDGLVSFVGTHRAMNLLHRHTFLGLLIGGATFLPFEPFRLFAALNHYPQWRYAVATFLSRSIRYFAIAQTGSTLGPGPIVNGVIAALIAALIASLAIKTLRHRRARRSALHDSSSADHP